MAGGWTSKRLFSKFLISYMSILIIMLIFVVIVHNCAVGALKNEMSAMDGAMFQNSIEATERDFEEVERLANQISFTSGLEKFADMTPEELSAVNYSLNKFINDRIKAFRVEMHLISTFFIVLDKPNAVITPTSVYQKEMFYGGILTDAADCEWVKDFSENETKGLYPETQIRQYRGAVEHVIPYVRPLSNEFGDSYAGSVVVLINAEAIKQNFSQIALSDSAYMSMNQGENVIIEIESKEKKPSGKELTESVSLNGRSYTATFDSDINNLKIRRFVRLEVIIILVALAIGLVVSYLFSYRNVQPLAQIFKFLKFANEDDGHEEVSYNTIKGEIAELVNKKNDLNKRLEDQKPLIKSAFCYNLLSGKIDERDVDRIADYLGITIMANKYVVAVIRHKFENDMRKKEIISLSISELVEKIFGQKAIVQEVEQGLLSIIFMLAYDDNSECVETIQGGLERIKSELLENSVFCYIAVGSVYENLYNIWNSYSEAIETLQYLQYNAIDKVSWYYFIPKGDENDYYYPIGVEVKLINCVESGNYQQMEAILDDVYKRNFVVRVLSKSSAEKLLGELYSTVYKLARIVDNSKEIRESADGIIKASSMYEAFSEAKYIFKILCNEMKEGELHRRNHELRDGILKFIYENYGNPNLSQSMVADHFGFSSGYLSKIFKKITGENFIKYVEDLRMEKACELLKENLPIAEVAERTGYNNVYSFRRVFKKNMGITPSEYKG